LASNNDPAVRKGYLFVDAIRIIFPTGRLKQGNNESSASIGFVGHSISGETKSGSTPFKPLLLRTFHRTNAHLSLISQPTASRSAHSKFLEF
jgi:hypothetical protein